MVVYVMWMTERMACAGPVRSEENRRSRRSHRWEGWAPQARKLDMDMPEGLVSSSPSKVNPLAGHTSK